MLAIIQSTIFLAGVTMILPLTGGKKKLGIAFATVAGGVDGVIRRHPALLGFSDTSPKILPFVYALCPTSQCPGLQKTKDKIVWGKIWTDVSDFVCGCFGE
ncbi:uncharacterized protein BT62DRAFT_1080429 [Guyanagaster necrorhizus]|uniref:Uncharacterized protein n=1 Tax=Guyanagaster necrorhizus TaxID=856835 RepID=A0A9P7VHD6_9AGAR|nr:uncharacterized protein BT62DRAFT_1080429 [Guyanagaster necrorhizus MCA 3950]KAG7441073.1 hypothetical protein BT62DRAFT_1080429 [Guyanagaster necrorhizus MCA 3950]